MSILVCTTYGDQPHPRYWMSWASLRGEFQYKPLHGKQGVDQGHNDLIDYFLEGGYEWMLHIDSDAIVHPLTLQRLMSWNEQMVTALAFQRKPPYWPVIYSLGADDKWKREIDVVRDWLFDHIDSLKLDESAVLADRDNALRPVAQCGAHCLLTHRSVFEAIEPPWFVRDDDVGRGAGSDFYFYRMALDAGFQPMIDLGTIAGHLCGDWCVGPLDFLAWDSVAEFDSDLEKVQINFKRKG